MGRPVGVLIDRNEAIKKALEIIDSEGLPALSIRRLGAEIGINGTSLYHHFRDKEEILEGVRRLVMLEAGMMVRYPKNLTWQQCATRSAVTYRSALLRHPNIVPLVAPGAVRPMARGSRDYVIAKMIEAAVPIRLTYPIVESVETLAFGSAVLNPRQIYPSERFAADPQHDDPHLRRAIRSSSQSPEGSFRLQLKALLEGWDSLIQQGSA